MSSKRLATLVAVAISTLLLPFLTDQTARIPVGRDGFVIIPSDGWHRTAPQWGVSSRRSLYGSSVGYGLPIYVLADSQYNRSAVVSLPPFVWASSLSVPIQYSYDEAGKLLQVEKGASLSPGSPSMSWKYSYDALGNLMTREEYVAHGNSENSSESSSISELHKFIVPHAGWYNLSTSPDVCDSRDCSVVAIWFPSVERAGDSHLSPGAESDRTTWLGTGGEKKRKDGSAAWAYFGGPGTLMLASADGQQTYLKVGMRPLSFGEFGRRARNMGFVGILLSMYLCRGLVLSCLWIFTLVGLRRVAFWGICQLPLRERRSARKEMGVLIRMAQWGGLASYALWTIVDIAELVRG